MVRGSLATATVHGNGGICSGAGRCAAVLPSSGSAPACTGRRPRGPGSRPAPSTARSARRRGRPGAAGRPSRQGSSAARRPACRTPARPPAGPRLVKSSICAIVWLAKELLITKDGCPVALPRFSRRPSDSTMMERCPRPWPGRPRRPTRAPAA